MDFLANNPFIAICGLICIYPGAAAAVGYYIGSQFSRRGGPPRLVWPDQENGEPGRPDSYGSEL